MVKVKSAKGKSKKLTWKKIQHPDVDKFLEEKARDERLGLKDKPDDQIFFVDQLGFDDDYAQLAQKKREAAFRRHTRSKDGPLVNLEELNCFRILKPNSAVKDPVIKRNALKKGGGKKTLDMKLKEELRYFRQTEARQQRKTDGAAPAAVDLWLDDKSTDKMVGVVLDDEWLRDETKRNLLRNRSSHVPSRKKNEVKAVEVPHPGLSYNPSFKDHQELLAKAVEREKLKLAAEAKIRRATFTPKIVGDGTLPDVKSESEPEDEKVVAKLSKPKTKQQKRKERELKEKDMKSRQQKQKAKTESEVFRVKTLRKEIVAEEKINKARLAKKVEKKLTRERFGVKELGRFEFVEKEATPLLSDELPKGLVGAGGASASTQDLLVDRFKSLQKRNVIEPRIKQKQKPKYKPKRYQRECEKMEWEKTGTWNGEKLLTHSGRRRSQRKK